MKPLYLELQAFGPFVTRQIVNFEDLYEKGIFLIKGDTGSGKTTIFDAMMFALYGSSSGEGRDDIESLRCNQAQTNVETYVYFSFSTHGHTYYFKRGLKFGRTIFNTYFEGGEIDENGNNIPFGENIKQTILNKKAEEIIGLTRDQFRQVVLLPQGQFERFLVANSKEKGTILKTIFNDYIWEKYAKKLYEITTNKVDELKKLKSAIEVKLNEDGVATIDELEEKIKSIKEEKELLDNEFKSFDSQSKKEELEKDKTLADKFENCSKLLEEKNRLDSLKNVVEQKSKQLEISSKAETMRELIVKYDNLQSEMIRRKDVLVKIEENIPKTNKSLEEAKEKYNLFVGDNKVDDLQRKIGEYKSKEEIYKNIENLEAIFNTANKDYLEIVKKHEKITEEYQTIAALVNEKNNHLNELQIELISIRNAYFDGICGEIASKITDGDKCPVCGSIHHPELATKSEDSVSKEDLEKHDTIVEKAKKELESSNIKREQVEQEKINIEKELSEKQSIKDKAETNYNNSLNNLIEGIKSFKELEKEIRKLNDCINNIEKEKESLNNTIEDKKNAITELTSKLEVAQKELKDIISEEANLETLLNEKIHDNAFSDINEVKNNLKDIKELNSIQQSITEYKTKVDDNNQKLQIINAELDGKEKPDVKEFITRQTEIEKKENEYHRESGRLGVEISRLERKYSDISSNSVGLEERYRVAEEDFKFAKALRGDNGVGLERYVLAIKFDQIINEANRMLRRVHNGRYQLYRAEESTSGGHQKGLDLNVYDNRSTNGEGRSVALLSGGEKFLVSLALSIGMSTIAQNAGVQIEALFIDEGFGTLDNSSIQDAMNVLDSIQKTNGLIGIISHVEILEENITTHINVVKKESGSVIEME